MRILLLNSDSDPAAGRPNARASRLHGVAAGLLRAGHRVDGALAARDDHATLAPLQSRGLTLHALPRRPSRDVMDRLMAACRPDVVLEQLVPLAPHAAEAAARAGVLHLYEIHEPIRLAPPPPGRREAGDELELCLRRGFASSRGAVTPSPEAAEWARERAPGEFEIELFPAWSGPGAPAMADHRHEEWARAIVGARPGEFRVGFCGSFKPWHDLETLVAALAPLCAISRARLVLSGDGPARNALLASTLQHRVPTVFAGAVGREEAHALMACCDVIVLPYARSGADFSPLKLVEAMTAGRPIVATDTTSTRRVLGEGTMGLLVPAGDVAAMSQALEKLATQPALRERLAAAARHRAHEQYSWDLAAERLLAFATSRRSRAEHCA